MCIRALLERLSPPSRHRVIAFFLWPTALYNRLFCFFFPTRRRLWDRVHPHIILGSIPFRGRDVAALSALGVQGVVNMMAEWRGNRGAFKTVGIQHYVHAPTIDFEEPSLSDALSCAAFVRERVAAGETVYVHCREGKGRSLCVVIAYLMLYEGATAEDAEALVRRVRPHVARKAHKTLFARLAEHPRAREAQLALRGVKAS